MERSESPRKRNSKYQNAYSSLFNQNSVRIGNIHICLLSHQSRIETECFAKNRTDSNFIILLKLLETILNNLIQLYFSLTILDIKYLVSPIHLSLKLKYPMFSNPLPLLEILLCAIHIVSVKSNFCIKPVIRLYNRFPTLVRLFNMAFSQNYLISLSF